MAYENFRASVAMVTNLVMGIVFIAFGIYTLMVKDRHKKRVQANILKVDCPNEDECVATVRFSTPTFFVTALLELQKNKLPKVNDMVDVRYDPRNPTDIVMASGLTSRNAGYILVGIGSTLLASTVAISYFGFKSIRANNTLF
jgi:hypothetical protein